MGSDSHPGPELQAAADAARELEIEITLVGKEETLAPRWAAMRSRDLSVRIVDAPDVLEMTDKPARQSRQKARNSMAVGMELLRSGEGDAFVTAGNTGGAMVNALFGLGRIRGVKRPGLTAVFPVMNGQAVVVDIGANTECRPINLLQFGIMGSLYAQKVLEVPHPRVGLLSNGEEAGKGNELVQESFPLLKASKLNFIGNIEAKELFGGKVDVVVTDGFTGNILLKTAESVAKLLVDILREELMSGARTQLGALLARPAFTKLRKMLDPAEVGAAPLLGVDGLVFIGHGRSDARALFNAIRVASLAVKADLLPAMRSAIGQELKIRDSLKQEKI